MGKRYFWLRLKDDFFSSKRMKKLRKIAGGATYTIIYLKLQLLAVKREGVLEYTGLEDTFADELALDIDESPDDVQVTLNYLVSCGLAEMLTERELLLPYVMENVGSEGASAQRMREHRARKALELQGLEDAKQIKGVTLLSQSDAHPSHCDSSVTERKRKSNSNNLYVPADKPQTPAPKGKETDGDKKRTQFVPPTLADVQAYCTERGNGVDANAFVDYYTANGWRVGRNKMKDWKASVRYWERNSVNSTLTKSKPAQKSTTPQHSCSPDELIEYPPGSGRYIPVDRVPKEASRAV